MCWGLRCSMLLICGLATVSRASAQSTSLCAPQPVREVVVSPPSVSLRNVPRNTLINIDVDPMFQPRFYLSDVTSRSEPVEATVQRVADSNRYVITPVDLLAADSDFELVVLGLAGVDATINFSTSSLLDVEPPVFPFGPDRVLSYSVSPCNDDEGRYRISLTLDNASDNGSEGGIEYLVYLTRAEGIDGPLLLQRQYRAVNSMTFTLTAEQVATPVCISIDAVDTVGLHAKDVGEFCFDPLQGNFFEPCSVHGDLRSTAALASSVWCLLSIVALSVRRRRLQRLAAGTRR